MSTPADLPLEPDSGSAANLENSPEYGFNPLAIIATVKRISAEIAAIRAFLVKIAPVLDAVKSAMGSQLAGEPPGEFSMHAEQLQSNQPE